MQFYKKSGFWVIGCLMAGGFLLRLWGIRWGLDPTFGYWFHPDEWDYVIFDPLSKGDFSRLGDPIWYNVYHYFCALVWLFIRKISFWVGFILNYYHFETDVGTDLRLIGRLTSSLLGTVNIGILYLLGKRLYPHSTVGLLAAALLALSPLSVSDAHYLGTDAALALMATSSLFLSWRLFSNKKPANYLWGGLVFGLTFATKPNGVLLLIPFLLVFAYQFQETRRSQQGVTPFIKGVCSFFLLAIVGVIIGAPGLWLNFGLGDSIETGRRAWQQTLAMAGPPRFVGEPRSWLETHTASKIATALRTMIEGFGLLPSVGAGLGILYFLKTRVPKCLLILSFPLGYFILVSFWGRRFGERDIVVMIPFLALIAAVFFHVLLSNYLPPRFKKIGIFFAFFLLLWGPFWKTLEVAYWYRQDDNRIISQQWINLHIPPQKRILLESYTPRNLNFSVDTIDYNKPLSALRDLADYMVTSSLEGDRYFSPVTHEPLMREGRNLLNLQKSLVMLKEFDLKYQKREDKYNGRQKHPVFLDPLIRVYGLKTTPIQDRIDFPRPIALPLSPYQVVMLNMADYDKDLLALMIPPDQTVARFLRTDMELTEAELLLINGKESKTDLIVQLGDETRKISLNPVEEKILLFSPSLGFPYTKNIYPFRVYSKSQARVFAQLITDPMKLGRLALDRQNPKKAIFYFQKALKKQPTALECQALLAVAYAQDGDLVATARAFEKLNRRDSDFLQRYFQGAITGPDRPQSIEKICQLGRYDPSLLQHNITYYHQIPDNAYISTEKIEETHQENFKAGSGKEANGLGNIKLWSKEVFPISPLIVTYRFWINRAGLEQQPILLIDVLKHSARGLEKVGEKQIKRFDLKETEALQEISIPFNHSNPQDSLEFRLFPLSPHIQIRLKEVEVRVDLVTDLRKKAQAIFYALARAHLNQQSPDLALEAIERARRLDPVDQDLIRLWKKCVSLCPARNNFSRANPH
jgi:tetratricopeptide (TPR) repeat protein